ncbi:MAG: penicillin-binding protein 2 [Bacteroidales bacterium]|nr:penicillin-binding protein 2 [Bacteroidales bacterium]
MEYSNRSTKLLIGLGVVLLLLAGRLFYVQILNQSYKTDAANNSMQREVIYPPRGVIYDRNGVLLVGNRICYDILVTPKEVKAFDTIALARALDTTADFVRDRMRYYQNYRSRIGWQTLTFLKQIDAETYIRFAEQEYMFPGFKSQARGIREYPFNAGGNLLGYISEVNAEFLQDHPDYRPGDFYGRTGLEAAREEDLRGKTGWHIYLRDSKGRQKAPYRGGEFDVEAVPGKDITTTIDAYLQNYGQRLMNGKKGSLVAIEPSTGEILAIVSSPGIDVSVLSDFGRHYNSLSQNKHKPLYNRAVSASYPPGSVFKMVNGLIGLQDGVLQPSMYYSCYGGYVYTSSGRKLGCHAHRTPLNLEDAVMMSCNGYFCHVMRTILENPEYSSTEEAYNHWREMVCSFGFGNRLGSDFPSELSGNIPTSEFYNKRYRKGHWRFPTIVSLSIGQGEILTTPLQIANLAAIIANRGYYYIPHVVKASEGVPLDPKYRERHYTMVDSTYYPSVIRGMWKAVNQFDDGATANVAYVRGLNICGKTGTAQNPHGKDNSVFVCFAPMDDPKIAVAAYVENAGSGASWASPIASLLVEKYLRGEISPDRRDLEYRVLRTKLIRQ